MDTKLVADLNNNSVTTYLDLNDCIRRLTKSNKIEKAAILSSKGNVLARSRNMNFGQNDLSGVSCAFSGQSPMLMRMNMCAKLYTCFQKRDDRNTVIGTSEDSVLVLTRCQDLIILAVGHPDTPGSCLHEVTKMGKRMRYKSQVGLVP